MIFVFKVDLNNKPRKSSDGLSSKHKVAKPKATNQQKVNISHILSQKSNF